MTTGTVLLALVFGATAVSCKHSQPAASAVNSGFEGRPSADLTGTLVVDWFCASAKNGQLAARNRQAQDE